MEKLITVRVMGKKETKQVTLEEARKIMEQVLDDPIGDNPADGIVQYLLHYFPGLFERHLFGLFFSHNPHGY